MVRIGPFVVGLAKDPKAGQEALRLNEIGASGSQIFGGVLGDADYNTRFQGTRSFDEYDKMRNDGQVRSVLEAVKLPLLNADWYIEPPSDKPQDREIAERMDRQLREGMSHTWRSFLLQALLHLDYGVMPFEKVWELRDGLIMPRKLAPRLPRTVMEWQVDETGGLKAIKQQTWKASTFASVEIPVGKLLVFVNEFEGSNWRGRSLLRSAYKHWYYKDNLYRVQAIALEKRSLGVDVGTLKGDAINAERKREAERLLMGLHAHEKQFLLEIEDQFTYRMENGQAGGRLLDPLPAIEHHDLRIVRSILAEFLAMGAGSTGSLAMHKDKSAFFMMALGGIANNVTDTTQSHFIRPWVDYNWMVDEYPQLRHSRLEVRNVVEFAEAVDKMAGVGALTPDESLEGEARALLDVPPRRLDAAPRPAPGAVTVARQIEKLVSVGRNIFEKGNLSAFADISVPFKRELAEEIEASGFDGDAASLAAAAMSSRLKSTFIAAMANQMKAGGFRPQELRAALERAVRARPEEEANYA